MRLKLTKARDAQMRWRIVRSHFVVSTNTSSSSSVIRRIVVWPESRKTLVRQQGAAGQSHEEKTRRLTTAFRDLKIC